MTIRTTTHHRLARRHDGLIPSADHKDLWRAGLWKKSWKGLRRGKERWVLGDYPKRRLRLSGEAGNTVKTDSPPTGRIPFRTVKVCRFDRTMIADLRSGHEKKLDGGESAGAKKTGRRRMASSRLSWIFWRQRQALYPPCVRVPVDRKA